MTYFLLGGSLNPAMEGGLLAGEPLAVETEATERWVLRTEPSLPSVPSRRTRFGDGPGRLGMMSVSRAR